MWTKINPTQGGDYQSYVPIFNKLDATTGYRFYFKEDETKVHFDIGDAAYNVEIKSSQSGLNDGLWHHYAITLDESNKILSLYIDGEEDNSTILASDVNITANTNTLRLAYNHSIYKPSLNGSIVELSVWDKFLTKNEIQHLMASAPDTSDTNLIGYWPLNEGSGTTVKDYSANSNDGTITVANWSNSTPTIYADTIYSSVGITAKAKFITENFDIIPTFSVNNTVNAPVSLEEQIVIYTPDNPIADDLVFTATNGTQTATKTIHFQSYLQPYDLNITLGNKNLNEQNITNLFIVDADNYTSGTFTTENSTSVNNFQADFSSGVVEFSESIEYKNYMLVFETDGGTYDQYYWFFNKNDSKLYDSSYVTSSTRDNFIQAYTANTVALNITSANWIAAIVNDIDSVIDTPQILFHPLELAIDSSSYNTNNATSFSSSDANNTYKIYETPESLNGENLVNIEKRLINSSDIHQVTMEVFPSSSEIKATSQKLHELNTTTNIITLKDGLSKVANLYLNTTLESDTLITLFSRYKDIEFSISFPPNAKGYEFYKKQLLSRCTIDSSSSLADNQIGSISRLKEVYSFDSSDTNASDQNILIYNKYDSSKGLQLVNDGDSTNVYEIDLSTGLQSSSSVATYEEVTTSTTCHKGTNSITTNSIMVFHFNSLEEGYGYENIALIKNNTSYEQGVYVSANTTTKEIYLNKEATVYLADKLNINSSLYLKYPLDFDWTYLSIPTNITLCTQSYQNALLNICDQSNTIESIFGTEISTKPISMFKYRGGYWSYYSTESNKTYNMDQISSINHTDGLLIYSQYEKELHLPYNIYNLELDTFQVYDIKGWHLVGNQLQRTPDHMDTKIKAQGHNIKYIMKQEGYEDGSSLSWKVSAMNNDSEVDDTIDRIEDLSPRDAMWIYVE